MSSLVPRLSIGHSPDADDAFMFYPLASGKIPTGGVEVVEVLQDIETLNQGCLRGELDVSAVSVHAFAYIAEDYALLSCGASMGDGYGPLVVANRPVSELDLREMTIAVPGTLTSAFLALRIFLEADFRHVTAPFDEILDRVARREVEAGLVIHEGQLTYGALGLHRIVDLGAWWAKHTGGLPLPLGGNVVRKDLGPGLMTRLTRMYRDSIDYGLAHREEALEYAGRFGRGLDGAAADRFVGMYVNDLTRDYGERGRRAIRRFLDEGADVGLVPRIGALEFVD